MSNEEVLRKGESKSILNSINIRDTKEFYNYKTILEGGMELERRKDRKKETIKLVDAMMDKGMFAKMRKAQDRGDWMNFGFHKPAPRKQ